MKKTELSAYKQARFRKANTCPICKNRIFDNDEFVMERKQTGHAIMYVFYHEGCVKLHAEQKDEEAAKVGQEDKEGQLQSINSKFTHPMEAWAKGQNAPT